MTNQQLKLQFMTRVAIAGSTTSIIAYQIITNGIIENDWAAAGLGSLGAIVGGLIAYGTMRLLQTLTSKRSQ